MSMFAAPFTERKVPVIQCIICFGRAQALVPGVAKKNNEFSCLVSAG